MSTYFKGTFPCLMKGGVVDLLILPPCPNMKRFSDFGRATVILSPPLSGGFFKVNGVDQSKPSNVKIEDSFR